MNSLFWCLALFGFLVVCYFIWLSNRKVANSDLLQIKSPFSAFSTPSRIFSPATFRGNSRSLSPSWIPSPVWRASFLAWRDQALRDTPEDSVVETEEFFSATISFGSSTESNYFPTGPSSPENVIPDTYLPIWEAENEKEVAKYFDEVLEEAMLEMTEQAILEVAEHRQAEQDIPMTYGFSPQSSPMHIVSQGGIFGDSVGRDDWEINLKIYQPH